MKKEPEHDDGHQHFDEAAKLLQEFQDAAVDRVGSRPSSNLSSLSNSSERDQHHLGTESYLQFRHSFFLGGVIILGTDKTKKYEIIILIFLNGTVY